MSRFAILAGVLALTATAAAAKEMTIEGRVYRGVEMGCFLIDDVHTGLSYLLVGGGPDLRCEGITASVTGIQRPDLVSYCMQGIPFEVFDYTILYPWFWPPPDCEITPEAPTSSDPVTITLSGICSIGTLLGVAGQQSTWIKTTWIASRRLPSEPPRLSTGMFRTISACG